MKDVAEIAQEAGLCPKRLAEVLEGIREDHETETFIVQNVAAYATMRVELEPLADSLKKALDRFDALSKVGTEYLVEGAWRADLHDDLDTSLLSREQMVAQLRARLDHLSDAVDEALSVVDKPRRGRAARSMPLETLVRQLKQLWDETKNPEFVKSKDVHDQREPFSQKFDDEAGNAPKSGGAIFVTDCVRHLALQWSNSQIETAMRDLINAEKRGKSFRTLSSARARRRAT